MCFLMARCECPFRVLRGSVRRTGNSSSPLAACVILMGLLFFALLVDSPFAVFLLSSSHGLSNERPRPRRGRGASCAPLRPLSSLSLQNRFPPLTSLGWVLSFAAESLLWLSTQDARASGITALALACLFGLYRSFLLLFPFFLASSKVFGRFLFLFICYYFTLVPRYHVCRQEYAKVFPFYAFLSLSFSTPVS